MVHARLRALFILKTLQPFSVFNCPLESPVHDRLFELDALSRREIKSVHLVSLIQFLTGFKRQSCRLFAVFGLG